MGDLTPIDPAAFARVMEFAHSMEGLPYRAPDGRLFSLNDGYPAGSFSDHLADAPYRHHIEIGDGPVGVNIDGHVYMADDVDPGAVTRLLQRTSLLRRGVL